MKTLLRMLIVEDDKYFALHLREILNTFGVVETCHTWEEAEKKLKKEAYDLVLSDLHLEHGPDGLRVVELAKRQGAMRVMITASSQEALIAEAYARGAQHVLTKKQIQQHLPEFIRSLVAQKDQQSLLELLAERFPTKERSLISEITHLLTSPWQGRSLLITGPTGTGKSVLGKLLADQLGGAGAPFVHLNCSEIPDNLIESELFGHEKGAFTGADQKREGRLKAADGGFLFLDEVGTMSMAMQQKLLKAIEDRTFYPVGANKPVKSTFTLITATCDNLQTKIKNQQFREDLYFRIAGLTLNLPPLSQRAGDIEGYVRLFQQLSPRRFVLTAEALDLFKRHAWPGNLRELRQAILALADTGTGVVDLAHAQQVLALKPQATAQGLVNDEIRRYVSEHGLRSYIELVEKQLAQDMLVKHQGKITSCIKELKISTSAFYRIMQQHQL